MISQNFLDGYNLTFEFTLVPIGSRFWIITAKSGNRHLTKFKNENDVIRKIKISTAYPTSDTTEPGNLFFDLSGVTCKLNVYLGDESNLDTNITLDEFKSMMQRSSVWIIRNPLERFKSGVIQKISQFYIKLKDAYFENEKKWENVFFIPNHSFHRDYPIDWPVFFTSHPKNYIDINEKSIEWFSIWKEFCGYFFLDMCRNVDISDSFLGDVHTQPHLYQLNLLFRELGILDKLLVLDITELNDNHNLFITEMGKVEYEKLKEKLIHTYAYDDMGIKRNAEQFQSYISETNGYLKAVNYKSLETYFKKSDTYRWEMFVYITLLKGRIPVMDDNNYFSNDLKLLTKRLL
jgi:hypothetical protein